MAKTLDEMSGEDIIDSRDIIARIEEMNEEREDLADAVAEAEENHSNNDDPDQTLEDLADAIAEARTALERWDADNADELTKLKKFAEEASGYCSDWEHGETLINDSYFQTYAEELAYDIGAVNKDAKWPNNHIDWAAAASELQHDYTMATLDGHDYWFR